MEPDSKVTRKIVHSVQVSASTRQKLHSLKDATGVPITRLIDQAVSALGIRRKRTRKQSF